MAGAEKIKILIVDDNQKFRETLRRLLSFDSSFEVAGEASSGAEAVKQCEQLNPDVVLMDLNMEGERLNSVGIQATGQIRQSFPATQVVIISQYNDQGFMQKAMMAGARGFISKPPDSDELNEAIHAAGKIAFAEKTKAAYQAAAPASHGSSPISGVRSSVNGKIITVYSPKGGTGSTTVATNLALAFRAENSSVVLVDANQQFGSVLVFLNEQARNTVADLASRAKDLEPEIVENVLLTHNASGLRILAPQVNLDVAGELTGEQFGEIILFLRQLYDFVVIDTSAFLNEISLIILENSDLILLLGTPDIPSIKNVTQFLHFVTSNGLARDRIMFIMNRYDRKMAITPERVGSILKQEVVLTLPLDYVTVNNSINRGIPFVIENKTLPISKSIFSLSSLIREKLAKLVNAMA